PTRAVKHLAFSKRRFLKHFTSVSGHCLCMDTPFTSNDGPSESAKRIQDESPNQPGNDCLPRDRLAAVTARPPDAVALVAAGAPEGAADHLPSGGGAVSTRPQLSDAKRQLLEKMMRGEGREQAPPVPPVG